MNTLCQAEIDWVMNHPECYDGLWHQKAVCCNIIKMYIIRELERKLLTLGSFPV